MNEEKYAVSQSEESDLGEKSKLIILGGKEAIITADSGIRVYIEIPADEKEIVKILKELVLKLADVETKTWPQGQQDQEDVKKFKDLAMASFKEKTVDSILYPGVGEYSFVFQEIRYNLKEVDKGLWLILVYDNSGSKDSQYSRLGGSLMDIIHKAYT